MTREKSESEFRDILGREFARIIPWGVLVVFLLWMGQVIVVKPLVGAWGEAVTETVRSSVLENPRLITAAKKNFKEAVGFALRQVVVSLEGELNNRAFMRRVKDNVKKGLDYSFARAVQTAESAVNNPRIIRGVKQNAKEGMEFATTAVIGALRKQMNDRVFMRRVKDNVKKAVTYTAGKVPTIRLAVSGIQ